MWLSCLGSHHARGVLRPTHDTCVDSYFFAYQICHVIQICLQFARLLYIFCGFQCFCLRQNIYYNTHWFGNFMFCRKSGNNVDFQGGVPNFWHKPIHWSVIKGTAQTLLSPSSYPAVNDDVWWRNTVFESSARMTCCLKASSIGSSMAAC